MTPPNDVRLRRKDVYNDQNSTMNDKGGTGSTQLVNTSI